MRRRLTVARRSLAAALGMSALLIVLGLGGISASRAQAHVELRSAIEALSDTLAARFDRGGLESLLTEIEQQRRNGFHFGLRTADRQILVDESLHSPRRIGWITYSQARRTHLALVRKLPGGAVLSVAHEVPRPGAADVLGWIIAAIGVLLALAATSAAVLSARSRLRALDRISTSLERVSRGDFSVRLPERTTMATLDGVSALVNRTLDRLGRRDAEMRSALSTIAHEMRTPLAHVVQGLSILSDPEATAAEREAALEYIGERVDFVLRGYDSILRLTHVQTRDGGASSPVDVAAEARNVATAFDAAFEESGRRLIVDCVPAWAAADAQLIAIAVSTLLENVLAHTPRGVSAVISAWSADGHSYLRVSDDGPGLPAEEMALATERFRRGPKSRGLGLGLTIVEAIARSAGGSLTLADAGPGLAVTLRFRDASSTAAVPSAPSADVELRAAA